MSQTKFTDSSIPLNYSVNVKHKLNMNWADNHSIKIYDILFTTMTKALARRKSKTEPVAFILTNDQNRFHLAAIVELIPNENEEMPANWSYRFTLDQADLEGITNIVQIDKSVAVDEIDTIITDYSYVAHGVRFYSKVYYIQMFCEAVNTLVAWLDENAKEGEEVSLLLSGVFEAAVVVENGEKIFAITPDAPLKTAIKEDVIIETK